MVHFRVVGGDTRVFVGSMNIGYFSVTGTFVLDGRTLTWILPLENEDLEQIVAKSRELTSSKRF